MTAKTAATTMAIMIPLTVITVSRRMGGSTESGSPVTSADMARLVMKR